MQKFSYEAMDATGELRRGVLEAASLNDAVQQLEVEGLEVRSVSQVDQSDAAAEEAQETPFASG